MRLSHSRLVQFAVLLAASHQLFPTDSRAENPSVPKIPIGMNVSGIADWEPGYPFVNLMWGARIWMTRNQDLTGVHDTGQAAKIPLDENGYPLELPVTVAGAEQPQVVFTIIPNVTAPGDYVVLYDGDGDITAVMSTKVVSSAPGRVVLALQNKGGEVYEGIAITRSAKSNHVRNIRIVPLAQEKVDLEKNPFRPELLAFCKPWHALRFMDWDAINDSLEKEWKNRRPRTFYTMVPGSGDAAGRFGKVPGEFEQRFAGGVAIELMIQLANTLKIDPWFCVPHRATPEYMNEFAKLVKAKLDPSLKVYLEYSNEVWNWQFQQAQWMLQSKVAAEPLLGSKSPPWKEGVAPQFAFDGGDVAKEGGQSHPERMGVLFRRCFAQWEDVFTGADRKRLIRVCAVQAGWLDTAQRTLKYVMANGGADALAPAAYFGPDEKVYEKWEAAGAQLTAADVLTDLRGVIEQNAKNAQQYSALARESHVAFITYEAGQHIQPKGQEQKPYNPALAAVQTDPGMYDLYLWQLQIYAENGCQLFNAFSSVGRQGTRWGSWGHAARYGQPLTETPKLRALLDANTPK